MSNESCKLPPRRKILRKGKKKMPKFGSLAELLCNSLDEIDRATAQLCYSHPTRMAPEQVLFALELMANGYDMVKAIRTVFGTSVEKLSDAACKRLGNKILSLKKVKIFVNEELNRRAEKLQTTADWCVMKYRDWANLDITDYIGVKTCKVTSKQSIYLKQDLEKMPKVARSAIKKIKTDPQGGIIVEFVDQKAALDSLAKLQGFVDSKTVVEVKAPIIMKFDAQDADA